MNRDPTICGRCYSPLRVSSFNTSRRATCPQCYTGVEAYVFPAWFRSRVSEVKEEEAQLGEATCYTHEKRKATGICDSCGRMMCDLCSIEHGSRSLCTDCIASGHTRGIELRASAKRPDRLALLLSLAPVVPFFGWVAGLFTAPYVLYLVAKHWRQRETIVPYNRWRLVVAGLLGIGYFAAVISLIIIEVWG